MSEKPKIDLTLVARQAMLNRGFQVDFPAAVLDEVHAAKEPDFGSLSIRDLSTVLWSSIDNDDSKDLDQIEYSESIQGGTRIYVAIADVNSLVKKGCATDVFAQQNTTSVYTGVEIFPMLPQRFSTDLTSLNENQKRKAVVIEMDITNDGTIAKSSVYPAIVMNKAQLTYNAVSIWLEKSPAPYSTTTEKILAKINNNPDLQKQILEQDKVSQTLSSKRRKDGALDFQTLELHPSLTPEGHIELSTRQPDRASHIIEEFMIASNEAVDGFLESKKFPCLQRVVRTPKNWPRMVELAAQHSGNLPSKPDGKALQEFLTARRVADPEHFPDLSLSMIKLLGRGEYVVKGVGDEELGHFGLAASNYSHTTAPNRRYPDLITQRLLDSVFNQRTPPYSRSELEELASHCTTKEDDANRVERQVKKSIAAVVLSHRIGETFPGIITGVSEKGVFVRISNPPVEGKVEGNTRGLDVGERVLTKLTHTDPLRGYIDFIVVGNRS